MAFPKLKHFTPSEFKHPDKLDFKLLTLLDEIREHAGVPIKVTDDYRPKASSSSHHLGYAVDISDNLSGLSCGSRWRFKVLRACFALGIERIGIYDRHIHIDISTFHDPKVAWWGASE